MSFDSRVYGPRLTSAMIPVHTVRVILAAVALLLSGFWPPSESVADRNNEASRSAQERLVQKSDQPDKVESLDPESPASRKKTGEEVAEHYNECHGEGGHSETPDIPSIAGFSMLATMDLLDTYRMGLRQARTVTLPDGSETNMEEVANALSEADEFSVVIYYANQKWRPHDQPFDAEMARRGAEIHTERCEK